MEGGIFAEADARAPDAGRNQITKSSVDGGVFGGYDHVQAPVSHAQAANKAVNESMSAAGSAVARGDGVNLSWQDGAAAPLQPLNSARHNSNASSIAGGIFGSAPVAAKPIAGMNRHNPNASSLADGSILG